MFDMQHVAGNLQKYRNERGMTQSELARGLSVSADALLGSRPFEGSGFIGIDGGGTKTEFVLIDAQGYRINSTVLEGSNPSNCGMEKTLEILRRGIDFLRSDERKVEGIFFGGAGLGKGTIGDAIQTALEKAYPGIRIGCGNDICNVIACCSQPDNCIAAISGTGCIVYSSVGGELRSTGGHGYLFDHNGSGFDIGRDAVIAALEDRDAIGPHTLLTRMVEETLGVSLEHHNLYRRGVSYLASFAPLVFQAEEQGDAVAGEILKRNSDHMAHLIRTARTKAPEANTVILSGSLFSRNDRFFDLVTAQLDPDMKVERLIWPPVWGACLRAAGLCGVSPLPDVECFLSSNRKENTV